ncbi:hypothetical protein F906_02748 [Acinetobacter pseudolwoffii]|uniref:O-antigen polymerase n=1 Tax=Acinetobacter pseudolwoffii TaxID=2053287 RepID=N9M3D8_9GAMM|nr:hypothetical protein [Acinetobacter pseudolwoffii]ENW85221.1 hypothetical protein F906_02748 [Acinetobacter pseudolwoffii]
MTKISNFNVNVFGYLFFILAYPFFVMSAGLSSNIIFNQLYYYFLTAFCVVISIIFFIKSRSLSVYFFVSLIFMMFFLSFFSKSYSYLDGIDFLKFLGYFFAGYSFFKYLLLRERINKLIILFIYVVCLISAFNFDYNEGNYLYYSEGVVVFSFFIISIISKNSLSSYLCSILIFFLSLISLYYINSRSAIFFFSLSFLIFSFLFYGFRRSLFLITPLFSLVIAYLFYLNSTLDNYSENRLLRLLFDRDSDTSLSAREVVNQFGKETFVKNWFTGDFGIYRGVFGEGLYAHNFYSFLAEFGIIGILFLAYVIFIYFKAFLYIFKSNYQRFEIFLLLCLIYTFLGILLSKSYVWLFLYFTVGITVSYLNHKSSFLSK